MTTNSEPASTKAPVLVFGGTFDPPHRAHVAMATAAADALGATTILVVPAFLNPQRSDRPPTDARHRLAMTRLAFALDPRVEVLDIEIARGGASYTVDTLRSLRGLGYAPMRLLIGGDQALGFRSWRAWEDVVALAEPIIVVRPPDDRASLCAKLSEAHPNDAARWHARILDCPPIPMASTDVRAALAAPRDALQPPIDGLDPAVLAYIDAHGLYRTPVSAPPMQAADAAPALPAPPAPPPSPVSPESPARPGRRWWVGRGSGRPPKARFGPYTASELQSYIAAGRLENEDRILDATGGPDDESPTSWRPWRSTLDELAAEVAVPPIVPPTEVPMRAPPTPYQSPGAIGIVVPIGCHPLALVAPYLGLLSLGCGLLGPFGLLCGILALRGTPHGRPGRVRSWIAIGLSSLGCVVLVIQAIFLGL
jgi:nicotinate-nucleotide adenylyltransferase